MIDKNLLIKRKLENFYGLDRKCHKDFLCQLNNKGLMIADLENYQFWELGQGLIRGDVIFSDLHTGDLDWINRETNVLDIERYLLSSTKPIEIEIGCKNPRHNHN